MRSRWLRRVLVLLALVGIWVALKLTVLRPKPIPVTVFTVARGRVEATVTNSRAGTVESRHRSSISPDLGGRVLELRAVNGATVAAGDVLLRLDDAQAKAQEAQAARAVDGARSAIREVCLAADQATRELARSRKLAHEELISAEQLEQVATRADVAGAGCEAARSREREAQAALALARVSLEKTVLKAPFTGVVASVTTEVGEWISPSPPGVPIPPVLELIDPDAIYVSVELDEVDLAKVKVGLPVRVTMDAYPGMESAGKVVRVARIVHDQQEQNRTLEVEVELDDHSFARTLLPGASADVEVILETREDVLRVPSYSLIDGKRVLVVREDRLVAVPVETGLKNWEFVEVKPGAAAASGGAREGALPGLREGDRVVVSLDRAEVREGATVRIAGETRK